MEGEKEFMDGHPIRGLIIMLLLTVLNALVAAAEEAFSNVNESNVEHKAEEGVKHAAALKKLLDTPHYYRNVIEITVTAASLLAGMLYASALHGRIRELLADVISLNKEAAVFPLALLMTAITVLLIYLLVLFGILVPKKLAKRLGEKAAFALTPWISILFRLFSPFVFLLEKNSNLLLWLFGFRKEANEENVTEEEIISMVNEGHEQGVLEADEAEMISNIIGFNEKEAKDIMTHRTKVVAVQADTSVEEALDMMLKENYSRFPLYGEDMDDIIGVLHLKDVLNFYMDEKLRKRPLAEAAREPYFIPDTQNLDVLFHDMQARKIHMAIAVDEYGQTAGLVAMEDLLEEIVGDIQDEYDEEEELLRQNGEGRFIAKGEISLEDLSEETGLDVRKEDIEAFDTLNGLLVSILGHIPQDDEKFFVEYEGFLFQPLEIHDKFVTRVQVEKVKKQEEETEKSGEAETPVA